MENLIVTREFKIGDHVFGVYDFFDVADVVSRGICTVDDVFAMTIDGTLMNFQLFVKTKLIWMEKLCSFEADFSDFYGLKRFKLSNLRKLTKLAKQIQISVHRGKRKKFINYLRAVEILVKEIQEQGTK